MSVTFAQGFSAAGVEAGISSIKGKKDLALVVNDGPLDAAAGRVHCKPFLRSSRAVDAQDRGRRSCESRHP